MDMMKAVRRNLSLVEEVKERYYEETHQPLSNEAAALIVLAAQVEDLTHEFVENIHRAGEGS